MYFSLGLKLQYIAIAPRKYIKFTRNFAILTFRVRA